jgi:hypothetical protein
MSDTQNTEWVQVEDWSTIAKGTRVKATRANGDELSFIASYAGKSSIGNEEGSVSLDAPYEGWSLFIEKPKVQLPTTPGYYFDKDGDPWKLWAETEDTAQHWRCGDDYMDATDARGFAPFTLLRPVAEVAAEVLAEAHSAIEGSLAAPHSALAAIAAKWATK